MNDRDKLNDYRYRLDALERELAEQRVQATCKIRIEDAKKELETSEALYREEEELKRLKECGDTDIFPNAEPTVVAAPVSAIEVLPYDYALDLERQRMNLEEARLKFLQNQINCQIEENLRLKERLAHLYSRPAPTYHYQASPVSVAQTTETERNELIAEEVAVTSEEEDGDDEMMSVAQGSVVFDGNTRLTFLEAYALLSPTQKHFCDGLLAYACKQSGEKQRDSKFHVSVGCGFTQVMKVMIKNNMVVICARMEDNDLRNLRLSDTDTPIKTRETTVKVVDNGAYETAKRLIDLRIGQIAESLAEKEQLRKEKRRKAYKGEE